MKRFFSLVVVGVFIGAADCGGAADAPTLTTLRSDVFTPRCGNATGCHSADNPARGLNLKDDPFAALVDQATVTDPSKKYVVPGDPESSLLLTILKTGNDSADPALVTRPMPPGFTLPQETLDDIEAWIAAGAENN